MTSDRCGGPTPLSGGLMPTKTSNGTKTSPKHRKTRSEVYRGPENHHGEVSGIAEFPLDLRFITIRVRDGQGARIWRFARQKLCISDLQRSCADLCSINNLENIHRKGFRAFGGVGNLPARRCGPSSFLFVNLKQDPLNMDSPSEIL